MIKRRKAKIIRIGDLFIGGSYPVVLQAMTKTQTKSIRSTVNQINRLGDLGAKIVRVAVRDREDALAIKKITQKISIPLVADIHFDYKLAIAAIRNGASKIRLNPGNIYKKDQVAEIVKEAKKAKIPIRVGVNSGSIRNAQDKVLTDEKSKKYASDSIEAEADNMAKSALEYIKLLESLYFHEIIVSLKSSDVSISIQAYKQMARYCAYPFHIGITATGPSYSGIIKSSIGIGTLLTSGIGDTIRVSLTASPEDEVMVGKSILGALGLHRMPVEIISCPTCGRCQVDLIKVAKTIEDRLRDLEDKLPKNRCIKVAIMGCVVNGPGEARQADLGVAFGKSEAILFREGEIIAKVPQKSVVEAILESIASLNRN